MKTFLSIFSIAVVAMLLAVPTVAQTDTWIYNPPGFYVNWTIGLNSPSLNGGSGTAQYYIATPSIRHTPNPSPKPERTFTKLAVECEYLTFPDLTPLYVFVGPGQSPKEPFGKLMGQMQVSKGSATWTSLRPPAVKKGTTVTIVHDGIVVMQGEF